MYNKSQLSRDKKNAKKQPSMPNPFGKDVDYISQMGYRDDSPFKDRPYIDINTPNGTIDMSNTGVDLIANGRFLPKYSGTHQFDTNVVREERIAEEGGEYLELDEDQIAEYRAGGYVVEELPEEDNRGVYSKDLQYPNKRNPANSFTVTDPRSMQDGGNLPSEVSVSYLPKGERSYYDPRIDAVYLDPNASEEELNHEMAHAWQNRKDGFRSDPYSPKLRPSTAASDEQAATYFNRKGDDVNRYINNLKTIAPELGGHTWNEDLDRFIPDQLKYDKVIDPLMYSDPTTLEGEAEYMSQVYGRPPLGIKQAGGSYEIELTDEEIDQYRKGGYVVEELPEKDNGGVYSQDIPYPPKHNPANSFAVNDPRSMQPGGGVKYTVDPRNPNVRIYNDKYAYNLAKKAEQDSSAAYNNYRNNMIPPAFTYDERNWAGMKTGNKVKPKPSDKDVKHIPATIGQSMVRNKYTWQGIQNNADRMDDYDYKCYEGDPRVCEKGLVPEFRGIKPSGYDVIDWTYPTGNKSRAVVSVFDKPKIKNIYKEQVVPKPTNSTKPKPTQQRANMVQVDYPTSTIAETTSFDENGNPVTEKVYYDVPKNVNESFTPPPINDDLEFEPPVEAQSTNPDPWNDIEPGKKYPKAYLPNYRTGVWSATGRVNPEQKKRTARTINLEEEYGDKYNSFAEGGSIMDLDLTEEEIEEYRRGGYVVEELPTAQDGLETGVVESKTPWAGAANFTGEETTPPVIFEGKDVAVKAQGPEWAKFQKEYESSKPFEKFLYGEQEKYLRKNKGLNKAAGVSMDNFPQAERIRVKQEYDQKMNDYITRRLGKSEGFNPRRRGEWVDQLTDREKQIVAGSRYGSKLQPDAWSRFMSGARSIYNAGPLSDVTGDITTQIPGYTKKENKAALNNWAEGIEAGAPLDILGMVVANKMENMNIENPSWYSGEMMANVDYGDVAAMNPLTLLDLYGLPQAGVSLGRGIAKGSKALGQTLETQKALLSNAYNNVATGNSPLTDLGVRAWKVERPSNNSRYTGLSRPYIARTATDEEAKLLSTFGKGMQFDSQAEWDAMDALTKSGFTDFSKSNTPISRIPGYYRRGSDEQKAIEALKRGDVFATPSEESIRTWSAGVPDVTDKEYLQGSTRLVIPSRYTKNLGNHFAAMPYDDVRVGFIHEDKVNGIQPYLNVNATYENELMGNIPEGFKVIGTSKEDGLNNLIIKPIKNSGSSSQFTRSGLGGMDMSNHVIKNVDYYTQLLNTYDNKALPAANRKFYKDLIANVKKQDGVVTERQLNELKRLATGNFDFGSKGYNKGYQEGGTSEPPVKTLPEVTVRPKTLGSIVDNRPEYTKGYYDPWGVSDNTLENVLEIFDPTGMTSWDDVVRAERKFGKDSWQANLEKLGAMPFLGKAAKTLKGVRVPMTARQARSYNTTVKGLQGASRLGRGSDAYQAVDEFGTGGSYVDNQMTHFQSGGNMDPGNNALELHMFYDKDVYKEDGGYVLPQAQNGMSWKNKIKKVFNKEVTVPTNQQLAQYLNPEYQRVTEGQEISVKPTGEQISSTYNDFMYSKAEAESDQISKRASECFSESGYNCAQSAFSYYDKYVAPKLPGGKSSWQLKESAGMYSGDEGGNPSYKDAEQSWDSWDLAGGFKRNKGKLFFTSKDNNNRPLNDKFKDMNQTQIEQYYRDLKLPLGTIINGGGADDDDSFRTMAGDTGKGYNTEQGLSASNHTTIVVGYDRYGTPYIYDEGHIHSIADPNALVNTMGITNIISPKENVGYTFNKIKKGKNWQQKIEKLNLNLPSASMLSDIDEMKPFMSQLEKNKKDMMNTFKMSNDEYDEYAKRAVATALTETKGGQDDASWRYGIVPAYVTDKIGIGDSQGITQIDPQAAVWAKKNGEFSNPGLVKQLDDLGISEWNYDPWNPNHQAIVTMGLLKENKKLADTKFKEVKGNNQDLADPAKGYYMWNSPRTVYQGEAQGDNINVKRFMDYYDMLNMYNKKDGGGVEYLTQKQIDELRAKGYHVVEE